MDFTRILERLRHGASQRFSFYDAGGKAVEKTGPSMHADVQATVARFRSWGIEAGMRIGLLATNSYEWVLCDLALMEMKCTSVAFPEEFGFKTADELVEKYELSLLLLSRNDRWPKLAPSRWTAFIDEPAAPATVRPGFGGLTEEGSHALVFSSGTAGKIKCLVINDRGVADSIACFYRRFDIGPGDRFLVFLPLSNYQQRICVYGLLFYGVDVALVKPADVFKGFQSFRPSLFLAPPLLYESVYAQFQNGLSALPLGKRTAARALMGLARVFPVRPLRRLCYGRIHHALGGNVRMMWTGMAPIKRRVLAFFGQTGLKLYEAYGVMECAIIASNGPGQTRVGSVGRPLDPGSVVIAGDGEVIIRKAQPMSRGYLECEEGEQAATFLPDGSVATGDVGRFDDRGYLHLIGRKKQIIITSQGIKIQPEPLEARIAKCHAVEQACLFGSNLPYLVALVSVRPPRTEQADEEIREVVRRINETLPTQTQIVKTVITTDAFTLDKGFLTRNLKLDRKAIFRHFEKDLLGSSSAAAAGVAPGTEALTATEEKLAEIWRQILSVGRVAKTDSFFALGGDSIMATQVLSRVRDAFQLELPVRTLLEAQTLSELALCIDGLAAAPATSEPSIERVPRAATMALSYAQQRLWVLYQLQPDAPTYNVPGAVRLSGRLELAALEASLNEVVRRHEALRTTFGLVDDEPVQVLHVEMRQKLPLVDLTDLPAARREAEVQRLALEEAGRPFDLSRGPLLRTTVLRVGPEEHVLLLSMHHIVSDGWSLAPLIRELSVLYKAFVAGHPSPLPELAIQYVDYADWQRRWLQGDVLGAQLRYWKEQLAGIPSLLPLPTDRPRPAVRSSSGAQEAFELPKDLADGLKALSRGEGATLFMTLLAAFQALLYRYTGEPDVVVGCPIANRNRAETEALIGFFANTLALRARLDGDPTFRELVRQVRNTTFDAYKHQDLPFEKLVEELQPERSLSHTPVFQVMFVLQNSPVVALQLEGLALKPMPLHSGTAKFDLLLQITDLGGPFLAELEYSTDLFDRERIEQIWESYRLLLRAAVANPDERVTALPVLTEAERRRLVVHENATRREYPGPRCLHELFEEQASRTPTAPAVVLGDEVLTYDELDRRANRLAHFLRGGGVGPESLVAVAVDRSFEMMVALFGVLKAGAAYVPLDPDYPRDRLGWMLEDSRARIVLTQSHLAGALPSLDGRTVVCLDADGGEIARESDERPRHTASPRHLAYVIYTSGSTGRPKGAMNEHGAIVNRLQWMQEAYAIGPEDAVLQKTPLSFDVSVWELFWPLLTGARQVLARPGGHRDATYLADLIHAARVTTVHFVPSMLRVWLEEPDVERCASLRRVICSGEALGADIVARFFQRSRAELHNLYGPTEAAVDVTWWPCPRGTNDASVPIGRPIANTAIHLLDGRLEPVPMGVTGELYIGGTAVGRGYWSRPELTAERFIADPFSEVPGARLYRTGDLARRRANGAVEFVGRTDHQEKIRGFRIEMGEIESVLESHPAVEQAAVVTREYGPDDKRLIAYLVADPVRARPVRQLAAIQQDPAANGHPVFELPNGMTLFHRNRRETEFVYREIFEHNGYSRHGITLADGDCVFDVGANIGLFDLFLASRARDLVIYAFEPLPAVFTLLELNARLCPADVRPRPFGLSNRTRQAVFTYYPNVSILSGYYADGDTEREVLRTYELNRGGLEEDGLPVGSEAYLDEVLAARVSGEAVTCGLKTLSEVLRDEGVDRIDLLKIDVEKSEQDILDGIEEADWARIRQLVVEVHDIDGRRASIEALLCRHGYDVHVEEEPMLKGTGLHTVYAVRERKPGRALDRIIEDRWYGPGQLTADLRVFLTRELPEYMVPSAFVPLDAFPLTPSGKLDRRALPSPDKGRAEGNGHRPPTNDTERELIGLWKQILKQDVIGIDSSFFELGGHSLLAAQLVSRVRTSFQVELPLQAVFKTPTVAAMAEQIELHRWAGERPDDVLVGDREEGAL